MNNTDSLYNDVIFIRGKANEVILNKLERFTTHRKRTTPLKPPKVMTLVYEYHFKPERFIRPLFALPGKHLDLPGHYGHRGIEGLDEYIISTAILSDLERQREWFTFGIADTRGIIWFVDP